jgi:hypothetical protein
MVKGYEWWNWFHWEKQHLEVVGAWEERMRP